MTDREKLLDLLQQGRGKANEMCQEQAGCEWCEYQAPKGCTIGFIVDYLIANGVVISNLETTTMQQWIPVAERLPEPFVSVLVQMPGESPFPTVREGFISKDGIWHSALYDREPGEVTHWQPMPQPPKGE